MFRSWIEAMRLRTLPVSMSGVIAGIAVSLLSGGLRIVPALLTLLFALLAQISSNFANEYFDYKNGIDAKGREGFRRGVTEGDISPQAMKNATFITLFAAAITGCLILFYGSWWMIPIGISIGIFALAYSAGPYPLSHHGLGDIAVIIFFGIVPVTLTSYLQLGNWENISLSLPLSVAIGLLAANVLIVNNYRDMESDKSVGKKTTVVLFGRGVMGYAYLLSGTVAMGMMFPLWELLPLWSLICPSVYLVMHLRSWRKMVASRGGALNPILGETARNLLLFTTLFLICVVIYISSSPCV